MISFKNSSMLTQARQARFQPNLFVQILMFLAVFGVSQSVISTIVLVPTFAAIFTDREIMFSLAYGDVDASISAAMSIMEKPWFMLISLFTTGITTAICILYCRFIEKRPIASMGFRRSGWLVRYLTGYAIGTVMLLLCAGILWLMGDLDFAFAENISVLYLMAFFVGFLIQGMSEEVMVRGFFMVSMTNRCHTALAVAISSVAFALLHLGNSGISLIAMLNLTLFGLFMGVYILRTDDLWGACAIHSAWNFAQGNLVGVRVSGMAQMPTVAIMNPQGEFSLFHGGSFGIEGGLIATAVILAAIALTLFLPQKAGKAAFQTVSE